MVTVSYRDANPHHNVVMERSVTRVLDFLNDTIVEWHRKKQYAVETATCGSEYSFTRAYVDKILDLRITLRHLGVSIRSLSHVISDNKSVVDSSVTHNGKFINDT